ncbi:MAG: hypothetical protein QOF63_4181 [Thermoanaerobaculia bacterium]|nr:hypothetical protein [Thermoanaerobaculia bacterium]
MSLRSSGLRWLRRFALRNDGAARSTPSAVILRCSPFFRASLEGCGHRVLVADPSRRLASARLLRMTVLFGGDDKK